MDGGFEELREVSASPIFALRPQRVVRRPFVKRLSVGVSARAPIDTVQVGVGEPSEQVGALGAARTDRDLLEDVVGTG